MVVARVAGIAAASASVSMSSESVFPAQHAILLDVVGVWKRFYSGHEFVGSCLGYKC